MKRFRVPAFMITVVYLLAACASQPFLPTLKLVNQLGGGVKAIAVHGTTLVTAEGARVIVIDVSDPAHPKSIKRSLLLPEIPNDLAVTADGRFVLASISRKGMLALDLKADRPTVVGKYDSSDGSSYREISIDGQTAYVAASGDKNGIRVIDLSALYVPGRTGVVDLSLKEAVAISDECTTKISASNGVVLAINASDCVETSDKVWTFSSGNPNNHLQAGAVTPYPSWLVVDVVVTQLRSYILTNDQLFVYNDGGEKVIDLPQHSEPAFFSFESLSIDPVDPDIAYIAYRRGGILIVNIKTKQITQMEQASDVTDVVASGNGYLYAKADYGGVYIVDVRDSTAPKAVGSYMSEPGQSTAVFEHHGYVFASNYLDVQLFDVRNPSEGIVQGSMVEGLADKRIQGAVFSGERGVAWGHRQVLSVLNVNNPADPWIVREVALDDYPYRVRIAGNIAYVQVSRIGHSLRKLDLESGQLTDVPIERISTFDLLPDGNLIVSWGRSNSASNLTEWFLSVINPTSGQVLNSLAVEEWATHLEATGATVSVYEYNGERVILYNATASGIKQLSVINDVGPSVSDIKQNGAALLIASYRKLQSYDITEPTQPVNIGNAEILGGNPEISFGNNLVFATAGDGGLYIFR